jgi:hypothetical protein
MDVLEDDAPSVDPLLTAREVGKRRFPVSQAEKRSRR